jgi:predicted  nucleic acid-binding Zn-ribbon protein
LRETVGKLVALQAIDDEASGFTQERSDLLAKIVRLKELLGLMKAGLSEKKEKLAEATKWYRDKDGELKSDQEKVDRAKQKLQAVTKNKEYMAMQKEIESLRKVNLTREEEILKLLEAMETYKASISDEQSKIKVLEAEVKAEEVSNADRITELDTAINKINSRKKEVIVGVKPALISRYRRIFGAREGKVMRPVNNGACTGCNFAVPPQQLVRVEKGITLEVCRNCSRLLFWPAHYGMGPDPEPEETESEDAA